MIDLVSDYLEQHSIYGCKVVVALSGGPDSVFLLYSLNNLKNKFKLTIEAAYVNHGIRSETTNQKDFLLVESLCSKLDVKLHSLIIPRNEISRVAKANSFSVEAVARDYRYDFFNSLLTEGDFIAVGHNRDDQIETQIMRFFQGSSIEGLLGIKQRRSNIIRPIINLDKKYILDFLDLKSILYNIDHTNNQLDYLRNRVRHIIVPEIEAVFPSYKSALKSVEEELQEYKEIVNALYKPLDWIDTKNSIRTSYKDFIYLPKLKRKEEIYNLFDRSFSKNICSFRLPKRFLEPLNKQEFKNGEIILSGYGFQFIRKGNLLMWQRIQPDTPKSYFKILVQRGGIYSNTHNRYSISNTRGSLIPGLSYPFSIRSYMEGYPEVKLLRKRNLTVENLNDIIIVEKNNSVYAMIYSNRLVYTKFDSKIGIYIKKI